jgi:hypothetical protein
VTETKVQWPPGHARWLGEIERRVQGAQDFTQAALTAMEVHFAKAQDEPEVARIRDQLVAAREALQEVVEWGGEDNPELIYHLRERIRVETRP